MKRKPHMDTAIHNNGAMGKKTIHQILAEKLKETRMARGMTQTQLGDKAGCGQSHISRIEKVAMPTGPTVEALEEIAHALGLEAWELLVDSETTRQLAYQRMILGPRVPNEVVAEHLPAAPVVREPAPKLVRKKKHSRGAAR